MNIHVTVTRASGLRVLPNSSAGDVALAGYSRSLALVWSCHHETLPIAMTLFLALILGQLEEFNPDDYFTSRHGCLESCYGGHVSGTPGRVKWSSPRSPIVSTSRLSPRSFARAIGCISGLPRRAVGAAIVKSSTKILTYGTFSGRRSRDLCIYIRNDETRPDHPDAHHFGRSANKTWRFAAHLPHQALTYEAFRLRLLTCVAPCQRRAFRGSDDGAHVVELS